MKKRKRKSFSPPKEPRDPARRPGAMPEVGFPPSTVVSWGEKLGEGGRYLTFYNKYNWPRHVTGTLTLHTHELTIVSSNDSRYNLCWLFNETLIRARAGHTPRSPGMFLSLMKLNLEIRRQPLKVWQRWRRLPSPWRQICFEKEKDRAVLTFKSCCWIIRRSVL